MAETTSCLDKETLGPCNEGAHNNVARLQNQ